jgi:hypothetical protein
MRRRPRTKYTETQKALMWERWKKGETLICHKTGCTATFQPKHQLL